MDLNAPEKPAMTVKENIQSMEYIFQVADLKGSSQNVRFFLLILGVGIAARMVCNNLHLRYCYYPLILTLGFCGGLALGHYQYLDQFSFSILAEINPNMYLLLFFPIMLFNTAFSMDYHGFHHSTLQVLFISLIGFPVQAALLSLIFDQLHDSWTFEVALTFSIICCIIESELVFQELNKTQERVKHIQLLLQGEQLAVLATASFAFRINFEYYYGSTEIPIFFFLTMTWHILAIFFGLIFGFIISYLFIYTSSEIPVAVALTMVTAFFSFYMGHIHLSQAGVIATIVTGVMLSPSKLKTTSEIESQLFFYWDWFTYVFNTVAFAIPGIIIGLKPDFIDLKRVVYVIVVYMVCFIVRCCFYTISWPLLMKLGHHLTWKNMVVVAVGPYRAGMTLIIAMLYRRYSPQDGQEVLTYTAMLCLLSTLFNGTSLPILLRKLGMFDLTHARVVNLKSAIESVNECRNKAIMSLKMDRVLADANWTVVEETTRLNDFHLKIQPKGASNVPQDFEAHVAFCQYCEEECPVLPTKKEILDIEIEAKHRLLKVQLVSLTRQYETGTLSKNGMRELVTLIQNSMEKDDPRVDVSEIEAYWSSPTYILRIKAFLELILRNLPQKYEFALLPAVRPTLYKAINTLVFRMVSTFLTVLDTYFILNYGLHEHWPTVASISKDVLQGLDFFFYVLFLSEFVILVCCLGFVHYFKRQYHKIDFTCNVLIRTSIVLMTVVYMIQYKSYRILEEKRIYVLKWSRFLLLLRLNRLYTVTEVIVWKLLHLVENRLDNMLVQYYDSGKAFLVANDRTLKHLRHIAPDKNTYIKLRKLLEEDKKRAAKSIGLIQRERPNVAVTIKTKHAMRQVINEMNDSIHDIYDEGLLDDIERKYLVDSLDEARKIQRSIKVITPRSPENILIGVPWLYEEKEITAFLLKHARLVRYSFQDRIINVGDVPKDIGLIVLTSGLVKCVYKPQKTTIQNCKKYGALPNCDFLNSLKLEETQEEYVVSGSLIGEIGIVTNRPFDMTIICETAVQVFYIKSETMNTILYDETDGMCTSVFCKIWKSIGIRIALILLQYVSNFQGWLREKTLFYLERSFVPLLLGVEELFLNELVSDVILIEGIIMDGVSRSVYYAPFYIPRSTNRLILPGTSKWNIDVQYPTRLLIIPVKHAEEIDIMGPGGIIKSEGTEMQLQTIESDLLLPYYQRERDQDEIPMNYHEYLYARPPTKLEFQKRATKTSLEKEEPPPKIYESDSFSSDSDIPQLRLFQQSVRNAVRPKPTRRIKTRNTFNCIEDVMENSDGSYEEAIFDYERKSEIFKKAKRKKGIRKREQESDSIIQCDLTSNEIKKIDDKEWWWG